MAKKKSKANGLSTQGIIERFVIRARRVEAHSLVKSGDVERYADPKMTVSVSETGDVNIQHHACADEEAVESLAGRLRPFIVKSEPIYLPKVLDAISSSAPVESFAEDEATAFDSVGNWFRRRYENGDSKRYGVQLIDEEGAPHEQTSSRMPCLPYPGFTQTPCMLTRRAIRRRHRSLAIPNATGQVRRFSASSPA